jgi:hypothetical protein
MRIVLSLDNFKSAVNALEELGVCSKEDVKAGLEGASVNTFEGKYGATMLSIDTGSVASDLDALLADDEPKAEAPAEAEGSPFEDEA